MAFRVQSWFNLFLQQQIRGWILKSKDTFLSLEREGALVPVLHANESQLCNWEAEHRVIMTSELDAVFIWTHMYPSDKSALNYTSQDPFDLKQLLKAEIKHTETPDRNSVLASCTGSFQTPQTAFTNIFALTFISVKAWLDSLRK